MLWSPEDSSLYELGVREANASEYDREYVLLHGARFPAVEIRVIRRALDLRPEDVLLDLGCGTGRITEAIAPFCRHVVAVDRSERSLAVLRDRLRERGLFNVTVLQADVRNGLPVNRPVSKVVCVQLLQHIALPADRSSILRRAAGWLSAGGRCLVIDEMFGLVRRIRGKPQEIAGPNTLYFRTFTPAEIRNTMKAAGLRPIRLMGCGVLYWTRYRVAPGALIRLDEWASVVPGAASIAKFGAMVAVKD